MCTESRRWPPVLRPGYITAVCCHRDVYRARRASATALSESAPEEAITAENNGRAIALSSIDAATLYDDVALLGERRGVRKVDAGFSAVRFLFAPAFFTGKKKMQGRKINFLLMLRCGYLPFLFILVGTIEEEGVE